MLTFCIEVKIHSHTYRLQSTWKLWSRMYSVTILTQDGTKKLRHLLRDTIHISTIIILKKRSVLEEELNARGYYENASPVLGQI